MVDLNLGRTYQSMSLIGP